MKASNDAHSDKTVERSDKAMDLLRRAADLLAGASQGMDATWCREYAELTGEPWVCLAGGDAEDSGWMRLDDSLEALLEDGVGIVDQVNMPTAARAAAEDELAAMGHPDPAGALDALLRIAVTPAVTGVEGKK